MTSDGAGNFTKKYAFVWFENGGGAGPSWTERSIDTNNNARHTQAADMDGDGDMDVVGEYGGDIKGWENTNANGDGSTWSAHTVAASYSFDTIVLADLDGDAKPNVVTCRKWQTPDSITWWRDASSAETTHGYIPSGLRVSQVMRDRGQGIGVKRDRGQIYGVCV